MGENERINYNDYIENLEDDGIISTFNDAAMSMIVEYISIFSADYEFGITVQSCDCLTHYDDVYINVSNIPILEYSGICARTVCSRCGSVKHIDFNHILSYMKEPRKETNKREETNEQPTPSNIIPFRPRD